MKFTSFEIIAHHEREEEIQEFLNSLGKEIHIAISNANGKTPNPTILNGYIDNWVINPDTVTVTYYGSGRYGYRDWYSVEFPISWINHEEWKQELEIRRQEREAKEKTEQEALIELQRQAKEAKERAEYERLKKVYG